MLLSVLPCVASQVGYASHPRNRLSIALMLRTRISALSIETRISSYYGLFFFSIGSVAPFAALWFESLNITSTMSGVIFATPSIATVLFTVLIGRWADRLPDWRSAIIYCNWAVVIVLSWFLFRQGPWDVLIVWALAGLCTRASTPIMDAAALNSTQKTGSDFGRIRSFGSMGFVVGVLLAGMLFDHFGARLFVTVMLAGAVARLIAAYALPAFRPERSVIKNTGIVVPADAIDAGSPDSARSAAKLSTTPSAGITELRHPGILLVLIGSALLSASHAFNNAFSIMHWTNVGISTGMASVLWSVSVIAEVALMWSFKSVAKKYSARKCLLFACLVSAARWFLVGTDPSLAQLFLLQCLHAITFGVSFLATVNFIAKRVHEDNAAQAQSVFAMLMTSLMALSFWLSGWLYGQFGGQTYWAMAILALLGGACVAWSFRTNLEDLANAS